MLNIDGQLGEGGGQIVRTALALSLVTGTPFEITNIRARRRKPGLMRQHLTCLRAATEISSATVDGAQLGSEQFVFEPGDLAADDYAFDVGTAGSTALVLQTLLVPLATVDAKSSVSVVGGTHAIKAPVFEFVDAVYAPALGLLDARIELAMKTRGFFPAGGGRIEATITEPLDRRAQLDLQDGGAVVSMRATSVVGHLPEHIAQRELDRLEQRLGELGVRGLDDRQIIATDQTRSPGNAVWVEIEREHGTELISAIGRQGVRAEDVAATLAEDVAAYLAADAPVGAHLADQLLLPMAVCGGGLYRTHELTQHTKTQMELIPRFVDVDIEHKEDSGIHTIEVRK
jgi:RNA 3'-terminal phosphate cyclase (ATP)